MWARTVLRCVPSLSSAVGSVCTGYRTSAVTRRRACVLPRICPYSTWDQYTPSSEAAGPSSDWKEEENGAEDLPEFNIKVLVKLLQQENAKDLCVIKLPLEMKYAEYFVIVGGTSTRHLKALAEYTLKVYKYLKRDTESHVCLEGKDTDDWMCIDFGEIVVHFMLPEIRATYELEKLWTLRSHDDQLLQITLETLPSDFTFGLQKNE
ncbi:unnamed protein product [Staurois parvus]|uniref:Mitochondrial assembly of ribosomal large subunit protein 1 n=1 Tax=Staurois parvus TaxID=386267 RepID=A0ABN9CT92_9NEOB|nr:unnamed protein product [Staurois parvus]